MRSLGGSHPVNPVRLTLVAVAGGLTVLSVTGWVVDVARDAGWRGSTILTAVALASLLALLGAAAALLVRGLDDESLLGAGSATAAVAVPVGSAPAGVTAGAPAGPTADLDDATAIPDIDPVPAAAPDPIVTAVTAVALALTDESERVDRAELVGLQAMEAVAADGMLVVVLEGEALRFRAVGGSSEKGVVGRTISLEGSLTGYVIESGRPLRVDEVGDLPASRGFEPDTPFGPLLILPVGMPGRGGAALMLLRLKGRPSFTLNDVARARILAPLMGPALELDSPSYL